MSNVALVNLFVDGMPVSSSVPNLTITVTRGLEDIARVTVLPVITESETEENGDAEAVALRVEFLSNVTNLAGTRFDFGRATTSSYSSSPSAPTAVQLQSAGLTPTMSTLLVFVSAFGILGAVTLRAVRRQRQIHRLNV